MKIDRDTCTHREEWILLNIRIHENLRREDRDRSREGKRKGVQTSCQVESIRVEVSIGRVKRVINFYANQIGRHGVCSALINCNLANEAVENHVTSKSVDDFAHNLVVYREACNSVVLYGEVIHFVHYRLASSLGKEILIVHNLNTYFDHTIRIRASNFHRVL